MNKDSSIVITGGAGLVGQNLVVQLLEQGYRDIRVLDKSRNNLRVLQDLHPGVRAIEADLATPGTWQDLCADAEVVILLHAQIGGLYEQEFQRNNVTATENVLQSLASNPGCYLLHVSSSVVTSDADDFYTHSKEQQEQLVRKSGHPWFVLRPTLMFGWFDRKHFGWLSRFMMKTPVFPIPGSGQYLRQPLFAADFCRVIVCCLQQRPTGECVSISGKEKIPYIEVIREIKAVNGAKSAIVRIPVFVFGLLLRVYALFDRNPPFTVHQLEALVIDELFEDVDWEKKFGITATPLSQALEATFCDPAYSDIVLEF